MKRALLALPLLATSCSLIYGAYDYKPTRNYVAAYPMADTWYLRCFEDEKSGLTVGAEAAMSCPDRSEVEREIRFFEVAHRLPKRALETAMVIFVGGPLHCSVDCSRRYPPSKDKRPKPLFGKAQDRMVFPPTMDSKKITNAEAREACQKQGNGVIAGECTKIDSILQESGDLKPVRIAAIFLSGRWSTWDGPGPKFYHGVCHLWADIQGLDDPYHERPEIDCWSPKPALLLLDPL